MLETWYIHAAEIHCVEWLTMMVSQDFHFSIPCYFILTNIIIIRGVYINLDLT